VASPISKLLGLEGSDGRDFGPSVDAKSISTPVSHFVTALIGPE
jgi:hypothetical protein